MGIVNRLKGAGWWANLLSAVVTIATSWGVIVSAVAGLTVWFAKDAFKFLADPYVQRGGGVFLWTLWSYIGLSILYRLHAGIKTIPMLDYANCIIIEGVGVAHDKDSDDAALQVSIQFRNGANGAIRVTVDEFRVVLDGRTIPDSPAISLISPRFAVKGISSAVFARDAVKDRGNGTIDLTLRYGPIDGDPVRKYRLKAAIRTKILDDGQVGVGNSITSEEDTPL